jgi:hypothetical protein
MPEENCRSEKSLGKEARNKRQEDDSSMDFKVEERNQAIVQGQKGFIR